MKSIGGTGQTEPDSCLDQFNTQVHVASIESVRKMNTDQNIFAVLSFPVYVRDGGYPAHYDTATVIVNVTDINDHRPVFQIPTVYLNVPENAGLSVVHTLVATDADAGKNGEITYRILCKCKNCA